MHGDWTVPREWPDETAFIVAGGPSVSGIDLSLLKGRRVIVVNSSFTAVPFADFLFFADARWWLEYGARTKGFGGRIVTVAKALGDKRLLRLHKVKPPPGLTSKPSHVAMQRTSLHGAMNLAFHLGVNRIVLLGADMRAAKDGRTHHHKPHKWRVKPTAWTKQMQDLRMIAAPLAEKGVEVINCSAVSRIDWWPKVDRLEDCL